MLLCLPRKYRSEDDDYAPRDYSFVGSVAEGERRQQAAPIHKDPARATVRHRADPNAPADEVATAPQPPAEGEPRGYEAARRLPRSGDGQTRAASIAYPRPRDNGFAQNPAYAPQTALPLQAAEVQAAARREYAARAPGARESYAQERRQGQPYAPQGQGGYAAPADNAPDASALGRRPYAAPTDNMQNPGTLERRPYAAPNGRADGYAPTGQPSAEQTFAPQGGYAPPVQVGDMFAPDGSQYSQPANSQAIPDWLRVAQQNNMPFYEERRRRAPKVEAAPQLPPEPQQTDLLGRPIARRTPQPDPNQLPESPEEYEAAGYPPELIYQQRSQDQEMAANLGYGRKRHGAQLAAPPPAPARARRSADGQPVPQPYAAGDGTPRRQPVPDAMQRGYAPRADFAPGSGLPDPYATPDAAGYNAYYAQNSRAGRREPNAEWEEVQPSEEDKEDAEKPKLKIPVLGIAAFVAAMSLVVLWILQVSFVNAKGDVLAARARAQQQLEDKHPFQYRDLIEREAQANNLSPAFVAAIVLNESSFNPKAESNVGARGLMQMMPDTAEWVHDKMGLTDEYNFDQMYDPDANVHYACWYLAFLSGRFHNDPILVSAAFHAGQNTVQNWLNDSRYSSDSQTISLDKMADGPTKNYATRVLKAFATYRKLYYEGGMAQNAAGTANAGGATDTAAQPNRVAVAVTPQTTVASNVIAVQ